MNCWLAWACGIGTLNLGTPVEVADLTVEDKTRQTQVERIRVVTLGVLSLILQHAVAAEFDVVDPCGNFRSLLLCFLHFLYFRQRLRAYGDSRQRHQRHQTE